MNKSFSLHRVSYSPGYGDMLGGYHGSTLCKDGDGNWILVCTDRETYDRPTVKATYAVSSESVAQFEEFIKNNKVLSLENQPESNLFVTDYSPWSWSIDYDTTAFGKPEQKYCLLDEYKRYSKRDYEVLGELKKRFLDLRGEKITETVEENP